MKLIPLKITKATMLEMYGNQFSDKFIIEEIKSFQEQNKISVYKKIICNRVKGLFFKKFGLPTGYTMTDINKFEY